MPDSQTPPPATDAPQPLTCSTPTLSGANIAALASRHRVSAGAP